MANGYWLEVRRQGSGWEPYALPTAYSAGDAAASVKALAEVLIPDESTVAIRAMGFNVQLGIPVPVYTLTRTGEPSPQAWHAEGRLA